MTHAPRALRIHAARPRRRVRAWLAPLAALVLAADCAPRRTAGALLGFAPSGSFGEVTRVLALAPGVTATLVAPPSLDPRRPVDLVVYALPNGNTTAETIGRRLADGIGWRHDIQHIGAQTRALRTRGLDQAVVAYVEADRKSWPEWRARHGYPTANARIVALVDELRAAVGDPPRLAVTLAAHSGGGSFVFGFLDGQDALPEWLERIALLDANYSYEPRHAAKLTPWLRQSASHTLVVLAYDDREIMLDGKKVVSDSGGTWRATQRMLRDLGPTHALVRGTLGAFDRYAAPQVELLVHQNRENRILHTEMIGEMNGYMHALLVGRRGYGPSNAVLRPTRVYTPWVETGAAAAPR